MNDNFKLPSRTFETQKVSTKPEKTQETKNQEKQSVSKKTKILLTSALAFLALGGIFIATRGKVKGKPKINPTQNPKPTTPPQTNSNICYPEITYFPPKKPKIFDPNDPNITDAIIISEEKF